MAQFQPRPGQKEVLAFRSGKMGIAAVPGSGKTHTLAVLAAQLVAEEIQDDQEVLIVTLVNSAVDNFKRRINRLLSEGERRLLPGYGYRVRTLHGLAHDIVRERPGLVGLAEDFGIMDEQAADEVRQEAVDAWLRAHPDAADTYLAPELTGKQAEWIKRSRWPDLVRDMAAAFIRRAKDLQLTPEVLLERLRLIEEGLPPETGAQGNFVLPLVRMGAEVYADYQRSLAHRGVVDFDDLIRLALQALQRDEEYLARLRRRWPYILEDEAQDSSEVQEKILRLLTGETGNWVRVGDPNQAIYDTFTNADPRFLREFLQEKGVREVTLAESGRSQPAIIELANYLVDWTATEHPAPQVRGAFLRQHIVPTGPGDPQPNPPADRNAVRLVGREFDPDGELQAVAESLARWLPNHPERTVAVLTPRNRRGAELTRLLKQRGVPYVELLRSTSTTRETAGALGNLLHCLADPASARRLAVAFQVWRRADRDDPASRTLVDSVARRIRGCPAVEAYLWPRGDRDWLADLAADLTEDELALLTDFRAVAQRWHKAAALPVDQLILTLAADLFHEAVELALAHKLAVLLRDVAAARPDYRLAELVEELGTIARNQRRFLGFSGEESGFEPPPGQATVTTMHKAKGLEWDRVYLMSVNNYNFPSGQAHDTYIAEPWFIRDRLNLEAEVLAWLSPMADGRLADWEIGKLGDATRQARWSYVAERLRLLYVGITRARRDLILTWNTGRRQAEKLQPAVAFAALRDYWQGK